MSFAWPARFTRCASSVLLLGGLVSGLSCDRFELPPRPAPVPQAPVETPAPPVAIAPTPPAEPIPPPVEAPIALSAPEVVEAPVPALPSGVNDETLANIRTGMSYDEVARLVAIPGTPLSPPDASIQIYRWTGENGISFMARFEQGALVRKSTLRLPGEEIPVDAETSPLLLTELAYERLLPGTPLQEALTQIPANPEVVVDNQADIVVYKWTDARGASFLGRFEQGKLVRKTALAVRTPALPLPPLLPPGMPLAPPGGIEEPPSGEDAAPDEAPATETAPAPDDTASEIQPTPDVAVPPEVSEIEESTVPTPPLPPRKPSVVVASRGAARAAGQVTGTANPRETGSYRPRAELPEHAFGLRSGVYEVRISNPTSSAVTAGLRQGNRGKDVSIPAGGSRSLHVDQGAYSVHFVFNDSPFTLHQGASINIDGQFLTDTEVTLGGDGSDSQPLYYDPDRSRVVRR